MTTAGIIAEFNPFHSGHKYLIDSVRRMTGADYICVVMSGDFMQNGKPAFADRQLRTRMALECGADAVFMLPVCVSTQSANGFALGAAALLNSFGCVDYLCFGCETDNIDILIKAAHVLNDEPACVSEAVKSAVKSGTNYPAARAYALAKYMADCGTSSQKLDDIFKSPNCILGIEYIRALGKLNSRIKPIIVKRIGAEYLSDKIDPQNCFCSAGAVRKAMAESGGLNKILPYVPENIRHIYMEEYNKLFPVFPDALASWLRHKLLDAKASDLADAADGNDFMANRIMNVLLNHCSSSYDGMVMSVVTKNTTFNHVSRVLSHFLLGIDKEKDELWKSFNRCLYARLLGFRRESSALLSQIKACCDVPLISKQADSTKVLSRFLSGDRQKAALLMSECDMHAANHFRLLLSMSLGTAYIPDERNQLTII